MTLLRLLLVLPLLLLVSGGVPSSHPENPSLQPDGPNLVLVVRSQGTPIPEALPMFGDLPPVQAPPASAAVEMRAILPTCRAGFVDTPCRSHPSIRAPPLPLQ